MSRQRILAVLVLVLPLALAAGGDRATAQAPPPDAQKLFGEGRQLFAAGKYEEAAQRFETARRSCVEAKHAAGAAWMLSWIADCLERQGRFDEAIRKTEASVAGLKAAHGGKDHQEILQGLNSLTVRLLDLKQYTRARERAAEMVAMSGRLYPGDHPIKALTWNSEAACLSNLGRYEDALEKYEAALAMRKRVYAGQRNGDHPEVAASLGNCGHALLNLGRYEEALDRQMAAYEMWRRLTANRDHPNVAGSLANLAFTSWMMGRPSEALGRHEAALLMRRRMYRGDHPDLVRGMNNLAGCLLVLGRPLDALPLYREALAMCERMYKGPHPMIVATKGALANCLWDLGGREQALELFESALAMSREINEGDHRDTARLAINLAVCLDGLGRSREALPYAREAVAMRKRLYGGDHETVALSVQGLAILLDKTGHREEALARGAEALEMARRLRRPMAHVCAAALAGIQMGDPAGLDAAVKLLGEAIAQIETIRGGAIGLDEQDRASYFQHLRRHRAYESMVRAQMMRKEPIAALTYLERGRARNLLDLLERSRFDPLEEVERRARQGGLEKEIETVAAIREDLGRTEREIVRLTHAVGATRGRSDLERSAKRRAIDELDGKLRLAHTAQQAVLRRRTHLIRGSLQAASPADGEDIRRLISGDERMLIYSVTMDEGLVMLVPPPGGKIRWFALKWPDGTEVTEDTLEESVESYVDALVTEGRRARGLSGVGEGTPRVRGPHADTARLGERLFRTLVPAPVWKEVRNAGRIRLVPHGALHRLPFETLVVSSGPDAAKTRYWLDVGPAVAYGASGSSMLWCRDRRNEQRKGDALHEVVALGDPIFSRGEVKAPEPPERGALIMSVQAASRGSKAGLAANDVIVAYDGRPVKDHKALRRLENDAQAAWEDEERASDEVAVLVWRAGEERELTAKVGALGVKVAKLAPRAALAEMSAGGEVRVVERSGGGARYRGLDPLPGTRREVEAIRATLADASGDRKWSLRALLGEDATKSKLFELAPRARYLHLATHQLVDETDRASYSCLALTLPKVPSADDDGFLKLIDLLEHWRDRIHGCELVVLSACETQRGLLQRDEGVFAMPWGFHYAGCPSVIASLWRVDDESTAVLMADLYRRLVADGAPAKLEAFTQARRELRRKYPEPYFWAPFILIGDPR